MLLAMPPRIILLHESDPPLRRIRNHRHLAFHRPSTGTSARPAATTGVRQTGAAVDAGGKAGRGIGTVSPDSPDLAEFGSRQHRGWKRTRPHGERRGGTEVF